MIKPDLNDIKNNIVNEDGWGSYFIYDNFLDDKMFRSLCDDFNEIKTSTENIYSNVEPPKVWRENEESGVNAIIGGAGGSKKFFNRLCELSKVWESFIEEVYSKTDLFWSVFEDTNTFKQNVTENDLNDGYLSCKLSSQTNNYGYIIHPDARQKIVSFLLYLDTYGWEEDSSGGTDLWKVVKEKIKYDKNVKSMDYQMRKGMLSDKHPSVRLTKEEAEKIVMFQSIDFKPNRLIGFVRSDKSYHSIPPRVLPKGITRDCFQINLWNLRSREK
tara:strand:- start:2095 stop:2910 length:816 start_codon:yes stop_codon:yes gene_type:complete